MSAENTFSQEPTSELTGEQVQTTVTSENSGQSSRIMSPDQPTQDGSAAPVERPTRPVFEEELHIPVANREEPANDDEAEDDTDDEAEDDNDDEAEDDNDDEAEYDFDRIRPLAFNDPLVPEWNSMDKEFIFEILRKRHLLYLTLGVCQSGPFRQWSKNPYLVSVHVANPPVDCSEIEAELRDALLTHLASFFNTPERIQASLKVELVYNMVFRC